MAEYISKSEKKRRFKQEEQAAEEISKLKGKVLAALPVEENVREEIKVCHGLKGGALKRQIKYLAKVMRTGDVDAIFTFLEERKGSSLKSNKLHKEAEHFRDIIINEAVADQQECLKEGRIWGEDWQADEIDNLVERLPWVNGGDVRRATFLYIRTKKHTNYKELFKIIKGALDREEVERKLAD